MKKLSDLMTPEERAEHAQKFEKVIISLQESLKMVSLLPELKAKVGVEVQARIDNVVRVRNMLLRGDCPAQDFFEVADTVSRKFGIQNVLGPKRAN
jgi:hypothetical protein